jgi:UDP-N-acetylglucosamine 2-epimerase (non-hydrolysing)
MKILKKEELKPKVAVIMGTRPGIIMFSPIIRALSATQVDFFIIHSGQHYSYNMDEIFFEQLEIPKPKHHLKGISEKKFHGAQTAAMLEGFEQILMAEKPGLVLVGGDANTNLAGALAARKLHIALGHVEAGERSYDWRMPEEHNRRMIDHISEYLFATNDKGKEQLLQEKVMGKIFVVGNTIVDAAFQNIEIAKKKSAILSKHGLQEKEYLVLTTHREENVDHPESLANILKSVEMVYQGTGLPVFFPVHPRTLNRLEMFNLAHRAGKIPGLIISEALGYLDFLRLLAGARLILTDSGGVQQEACIFQVPCVTLRENTEWTETLEIGANILAGVVPEKIAAAAAEMLERNGRWRIPFGDGTAARQIAGVVSEELLGMKPNIENHP